VVLAVELPDKTLVATLVLTTRYRALPVFVGVCVAFLVQCVIAVSFGSVLTLLPERVTAGIVTVLFAVGAAMLLREGFGAEDDSEQDAARSGPAEVSFRRSALTSFGVLFAAEWGDASQLATAGLTAHYGHPFAVRPRRLAGPGRRGRRRRARRPQDPRPGPPAIDPAHRRICFHRLCPVRFVSDDHGLIE